MIGLVPRRHLECVSRKVEEHRLYGGRRTLCAKDDVPQEHRHSFFVLVDARM